MKRVGVQAGREQLLKTMAVILEREFVEVRYTYRGNDGDCYITCRMLLITSARAVKSGGQGGSKVECTCGGELRLPYVATSTY